MEKVEAQKILDRVANLARLGPYAPQDRERMSGEIVKILGLFDVLDQLPARSTQILSSEALRLREDQVEAFAGGSLVESSPEHEGALLKIPKVIG